MKKELKIYLASPRGFCAGVKRAIEIVEKSINKYGSPVYVRHEIVHNKQVVDELKKKVFFVSFKNKNWDQNKYFDVNELNWKKFSLSERDTEYSPSSVIDGNYQPFIKKYASESEVARTLVQSKIHQYGNKTNQVIEITTF